MRLLTDPLASVCQNSRATSLLAVLVAMMRRGTLVLLLAARGANAVGSGVWKDPNHYVSDDSLAGLRFIAEFPAGTLTMIGTEDGASWWWLSGKSSGNEITFDFSPKGGPADLAAVFDGHITWSDGNVWTTGVLPTAPAFTATPVPTSHGLFLDTAHYVPGSFAGVRVLAERPHHVLHLVGSDDGVTWWHLVGDCHGPGTPGDGEYKFVSKDYFRVDFSPKGGPKDVVGSWDHKSLIKFPDGNTWYKPPAVAAPASMRADPVSQHVHKPLGHVAGAAVIFVAVGALAYAVGRVRRREGFHTEYHGQVLAAQL